MSAYVVTFYSFKGGVGRSTLLAQVGYRLAKLGRKVRIWDLDLEAPGLHLMPDLKPEKIPAKGFLEWLGEWQKTPLLPPSVKALQSLRASLGNTPIHSNLSILPAFGKDADFAALYAGIEWHRWLESERDDGIALFRALIGDLSEDCDYLLIDSRTGVSNLGGWLAAMLPHATVLVAGYGEQNTVGAARIFDALESARDGRMAERNENHPDAAQKLYQLLVASPVPSHDSELLAERRKVWEERFGSVPAVEIPLNPKLLLVETLAAPDAATPAEMKSAYNKAVVLLEVGRATWSDELRKARERFPETRITIDAKLPALQGVMDVRAEKGATFEERMARLLELNGFKVERETIIDGNRVDLIARIQAGWNKQIVYWVECKDHQRATPKDDLEKLCIWLNGKEARAMQAEGMFIANDYSPAARSFAESQPQLTLVTPRELENKLFDFRPYLARVVGEYENSALFKTYVYQRIHLENRPAEPAEDALEYGLSWTEGAGGRLWLVLGDYGTGKSALVRRLAYELAKRALAPGAGEAEPVIPVFIDLKFQPNAVSLENLLFEHFAQSAQSAGSRGFNPAVLLYLLEAGRIVLLLDSFDEMGLAAAGRSVEEQFRMLAYPAGKAPLAPSGNRVLISCRTHFFRDQQKVKACTNGSGDSLVSADSPLGRAARSFDATIDELELFNGAQIGEFLHRHLGESAAAEMQRFIDKTYDLPNLAPYPILLDMMVKSLPELKRGSGAVTPATLYFAYTKTWLEDRSGGQLLSTPEQRRIALEYLAQSLWRRPERHIHHTDLVGELRALPAQLLGGLDFDRLDLELRTAAFLVRNPEGQYRFSHKSFLEYFYARRLLRAADEGALAALLDAPPPSPEVAAFMADLARDGSATDFQARLFAPLRDILAAPYQPRISENALRLLFDAARHMFGLSHAPETAAGAALERWLPRPLTMPGADLRGMNLKFAPLVGARLAGANLADADLYRANLAGADFSNAILAGVSAGSANFSQADLSRADLTDADLSGADLSGAQLADAKLRFARPLGAKLENARVGGADFSYARLAGAHLDGVAFDSTQLPLLTAPGALPSEREITWPRAENGFPNGTPAAPAVSPLPPYLLTGHTERVTCVTFSPDGKLVATASSDNSARLWDAASGKELRRFEGLSSVAFSPDGKSVATASSDNSARLWDAASGKELRRFEGHGNAVVCVAFSPDGTSVATASDDNSARLWNAASGKELRRFEGHGGGVRGVAFSPDGKFVATASDDNSARLWDTASGKELRRFKGHGDTVGSVAFSPDGLSLATASSDRSARLWDVATGKELRRFEGHGNGVKGVAFSPNGKFVATASSDSSARLWDAASGKELRRFEGHSGSLISVTFSPDGLSVATVGWDNSARLWDVATAKETLHLKGYGKLVFCVAFSPDGKSVATASQDKFARLWDALSGKELHRFEGHGNVVLSVAFSPDGKSLATASSDNSARLWDVVTAKEIRRFEGHGELVFSVAFSPDGKFLATASGDNSARLWDAASGKELRRFAGDGDPVRSVVFSPDGKSLATGNDDNSARLWDATSGKELRRFEGHGGGVWGVVFSPDGKSLATASGDKSARLWDAASGKELRRFEGHGSGVWGVAFSPDGKSVATGSLDKSARLWDAASGKEIRRFEGHDGAVSSVAFSPGGKSLATASEDNSAKLWDAATAKPLATLFPSRDGWMCWRHDQNGYRADPAGHGLETFWLIDPANPQRLWHPADLRAEFDLDQRE